MCNRKLIYIFIFLLVTYQPRLTQAMIRTKSNTLNIPNILTTIGSNKYRSPSGLIYQSSGNVTDRLAHLGNHLICKNNNLHTYFLPSSGITTVTNIVNFIETIYSELQAINFNFNTINHSGSIRQSITLNGNPYNITIANDANIGQCKIIIKPANNNTTSYPTTGTNKSGEILYSYQLTMEISTNNIPHIVNTFCPYKEKV